MVVHWNESANCQTISDWVHVEHSFSLKKGLCFAFRNRTGRNASGDITFLLKGIMIQFVVTMAKTTRIIPWQFTIITTHHWVILTIRFLQLVAIQPTTIKLNYLTSAQIPGQQNHHFHLVHPSKFNII